MEGQKKIIQITDHKIIKVFKKPFTKKILDCFDEKPKTSSLSHIPSLSESLSTIKPLTQISQVLLITKHDPSSTVAEESKLQANGLVHP